MAPWSQGGGCCPALEGEAGSPDGIEATVGRGKAMLFPLRVDSYCLHDSVDSFLSEYPGYAWDTG
jgi:hypothetical protein